LPHCNINFVGDIYLIHKGEIQEFMDKMIVRLMSYINCMSRVYSERFTDQWLDLCGLCRSVAVSAADSFSGIISVYAVDAELVYRGLPGASNVIPPLDLGLFIHPVFHVPYIPGSSIKGVLRTAYENLLLDRICRGDPDCEDNDDLWEDLEEISSIVFGKEGPDGWIGRLRVMDAYPVKPGEAGMYVVPDVITPHYTGGAKKELDVQPRPISFLALNKGVKFRFVAIIDWTGLLDIMALKARGILRRLRHAGIYRLSAEDLLLGTRRPHVFMEKLFQKAFDEIGFGAKTTRGYGYFKKITIDEG